MRLYRCDRCGEYVAASARRFFVRKPTKGIYRFGKKRHLCEECARSFDRWMNETEKATDDERE